MMIDHPLAAAVAFACGEAIVGAEQRGEMVSPVDVIALHRVGETLGVEDELVELKTIRVNVVGLGCVGVSGGAEVYAGIEPAIELGAAGGIVDGGHQRISVGVRLSDDGRASVGPIGVGERWRIER